MKIIDGVPAVVAAIIWIANIGSSIVITMQDQLMGIRVASKLAIAYAASTCLPAMRASAMPPAPLINWLFKPQLRVAATIPSESVPASPLLNESVLL